MGKPRTHYLREYGSKLVSQGLEESMDYRQYRRKSENGHTPYMFNWVAYESDEDSDSSSSLVTERRPKDVPPHVYKHKKFLAAYDKKQKIGLPPPFSENREITADEEEPSVLTWPRDRSKKASDKRKIRAIQVVTRTQTPPPAQCFDDNNGSNNVGINHTCQTVSGGAHPCKYVFPACNRPTDLKFPPCKPTSPRKTAEHKCSPCKNTEHVCPPCKPVEHMFPVCTTHMFPQCMANAPPSQEDECCHGIPRINCGSFENQQKKRDSELFRRKSMLPNIRPISDSLERGKLLQKKMQLNEKAPFLTYGYLNNEKTTGNKKTFNIRASKEVHEGAVRAKNHQRVSNTMPGPPKEKVQNRRKDGEGGGIRDRVKGSVKGSVRGSARGSVKGSVNNIGNESGEPQQETCIHQQIQALFDEPAQEDQCRGYESEYRKRYQNYNDTEYSQNKLDPLRLWNELYVIKHNHHHHCS